MDVAMMTVDAPATQEQKDHQAGERRAQGAFRGPPPEIAAFDEQGLVVERRMILKAAARFHRSGRLSLIPCTTARSKPSRSGNGRKHSTKRRRIEREPSFAAAANRSALPQIV